MRIVLIFTLLAAVAANSPAQTVMLRTDDTGQATTQVLPEGAFLYEGRSPDGTTTSRIYNPDEEVPLIVLFNGPPLLQSGANKSIESARAGIEAEHAQFASDLAALDAKSSKRGGSTITHAYRSTLNGVAVTTRLGLMHQIAALPYVRSVHRDERMKAFDAASNRVIGADRMHRELGATGRGVVVAVIDTGIDYTHPALGGGLGDGFKVIGGYDWVEDDDDPMDDNGHGTHVAGIIAGDDGADFVGVAPQVRLLAFRVLDQSGSGDTSDVIAAIERAVDPDGDPATDDAPDIINLSLGGSGDPDDPASQAVDNATAAGIVAVVAAGNDGRSFSIGSPGTARTAITVGASDNFDQIAIFSSRGPVTLTFANKPDALAPGVDIYSSVPGNGYESFSGTSMATPHVAGAAALLLERHPDWDPATVKSALMLTAKDTGQNLWEQGAGRIDVLAADTLSTIVSPANISFGNLDPVVSSHAIEQILTIRNLSAETRTYSVSSSHSLPGTDVQAVPSSLSLNPGESRSVTISAVFETANLGFSQDLGVPYVGEVNVVSGNRTTRIPFSVTKTPQLVLRYEESPEEVLIFNETGLVQSSVIPPATVAFPLKSGTYDIVSHFNFPLGERFVRGFQVREGVTVGGKVELDIKMDEMSNTLTFESLDRDGAPLIMDEGALRISHSTGYSGTYYGLTDGRVQISNVSPRIRLENIAHNVSHASGEDYVVQLGAASGVTSSMTVRNDPAAYRQVRTTYTVPSDVRELYVVPQIYQDEKFFLNVVGIYGFENAQHHRLSAPFERLVNYTPTPYPDYAFRYQGHMVYNTTDMKEPNDGEESNVVFTSPTLEVLAERTDTYAQMDFDASIRSTTEPLLEERFGSGMLNWSGRFRNEQGVVLLDPSRAAVFAGESGEIVNGTVTFALRSDDGTWEGTFLNDISPEIFPLAMREASFGGTFTHGRAFVDDRPVKATARVQFDTRSRQTTIDDPNPPFIYSLAFRPSENEEDGALLAVVRDTYTTGSTRPERPVSSVGLSVRRLGEKDWKSLNVARSEDQFSGAWPSDSVPGYYDLLVTAEDASGNVLEYKTEPAFRFGNMEGNRAPDAARLSWPPSGFEIDMDSVTVPLTFAWEPSADPDAGQTLGYVVRIKGTHLDTTFSSAGSSAAIDLRELLRQGETYTWSVATTDGFVFTASASEHTLVTVPFGVDAEAEDDLPHEFALLPNYPNPFNPATNLPIALPRQSKVNIEVYDVLGRRVQSIMDEVMPAGHHTITWTASDLPSGVYYVQMRAGSFSQVRQVALIK